MGISIIYQRDHSIDNQIKNRLLRIGKIQHETHIQVFRSRPHIFDLHLFISYTVHIIRCQVYNILNRHHSVIIQTNIIIKSIFARLQQGIIAKDALARLQILIRHGRLHHPQLFSVIQYQIGSIILRRLLNISHSDSYCTLGITFVIATSRKGEYSNKQKYRPQHELKRILHYLHCKVPSLFP